MKTNNMKTLIIYRLMNHDSSHVPLLFHKYTLEELNKQFNTTYKTVEEAIEAEPKYLFNEI
jgi:hypothetical protein